MSDDELNKEWVPNGRPQSTMARSFSLALDDVFKMDNSLADLDAAVDQKKKAVSSQTAELEELEARLKAAEERLKASATNKTGSGRGPSSPRHRVPLGDTFSQNQTAPEASQPPPQEADPKTPSRPSTAKRPVTAQNNQSRSSYAAPPLPGALPPTPGASEGEYYIEGALTTRSSADYIVIDQDGDYTPQHQHES